MNTQLLDLPIAKSTTNRTRQKEEPSLSQHARLGWHRQHVYIMSSKQVQKKKQATMHGFLALNFFTHPALPCRLVNATSHRFNTSSVIMPEQTLMIYNTRNGGTSCCMFPRIRLVMQRFLSIQSSRKMNNIILSQISRARLLASQNPALVSTKGVVLDDDDDDELNRLIWRRNGLSLVTTIVFVVVKVNSSNIVEKLKLLEYLNFI